MAANLVAAGIIALGALLTVKEGGERVELRVWMLSGIGLLLVVAATTAVVAVLRVRAIRREQERPHRHAALIERTDAMQRRFRRKSSGVAADRDEARAYDELLEAAARETGLGAIEQLPRTTPDPVHPDVAEQTYGTLEGKLGHLKRLLEGDESPAA